MQELLFVFGPPLAALLAGISPRLAVASCAVLLVLGTAWFTVVVRHHTPPTPREPGPSVVSGTPMRLLLAAFAFTGLAFGAIDLSTIADLDHQGHRGWAGVALAVWAFGSLIAGVVAAKHPFTDLWSALPRVLLAMAVLSLPLLVLRQPILLGLGLLLQGASIAPALGTVFSLVPLITAPSQLTEAFSWAAAAILGGVSAGSAITGVLLDSVGVAAGFGLAVAGPLAAAWMAMLLSRHRVHLAVTA
ncbi:MAG: hypothetical protein U0Y82_03075 [Thermoleophilia bacterium]